jgi:hypothetical protein
VPKGTGNVLLFFVALLTSGVVFVKTVPREPKSEVFEGLDYLSDDSPEAFYKGKIPVVFKWTGAGNNIFVSGSYDNWASKTPLVKR